ncbi:MAG: hypothetical protein AAGB32_01705, partial [Pseudomonadota bacterium]
MSSKSATFEYLSGLETQEAQPNYVLKTANARELVSRLPAPKNVSRNIGLVPDVQIAFLLSTSEELPEHIVQQIVSSEDKKNFTKTTTAGLCTSGRGMPVEIFLHEHLMMTFDPSGELLEEVAWHEAVHGLEGIKLDGGGKVTRKEPWSYRLQQRMLAIDEENEHVPNLPKDAKKQAHINYLR